MNKDLSYDQNLIAAVEEAEQYRASARYTKEWSGNVEKLLAVVKMSVPGMLEDKSFLRMLWEDESISSTGMGSVKINPAIESDDFRSWFAERVIRAKTIGQEEFSAYLEAFYDELERRLSKLCGRVPRLKLNRVLCAIFPECFTTIADVGKLKFLHRAMGGSYKNHPVFAHAAIKHRLDALLPIVPTHDQHAVVERLCLPWYLYSVLTAENVDASVPTSTPLDNELTPLPALLRRKGLTALKGSFASLMGFIQLLQDGLTRDEFGDAIKRENPKLGQQSVGTVIHTVSKEFDLCSMENGTFRLSARGLNLLGSQDPDELCDHLLTRILGVDNIIVCLRDGPQSKSYLHDLLKSVNPGWTSPFAPSSLLGWLTSLQVIESAKSQQYQLTDRGLRWAELITWLPQSLPSNSVEKIQNLSAASMAIAIPQFEDIATRLNDLVAGKLSYPSSVVRELHAGLWFHPVRHFAVLTGISGSGKTQLALNYSLALCKIASNAHSSVRIIPVQPGWFDASPLLGHVNVLSQTYRSAPFLDLLLEAADDPTRPYVAILDEINLSHPEQYLAPILSAMETQGWIDLHQLGDANSEVPEKIQYPSNLAIIGTLNMDETTHGLSDKVLDRAYTLEFLHINIGSAPAWGTTSIPVATKARTKAVLEGLSAALAPVRLHFGWRTISDVLGYLEYFDKLGKDAADSLDAVIFAKVLPKLRGEHSEKFEAALSATLKVLTEHGLSRCAERVKSLKADLLESGTARFWR